MSIDIAPETERVVREELRSGHFRSIDDLILLTRDLDQQTATSSETDERPIWEAITDIMKNVPGASQVDRHIYNLPKRHD